MTFAQITETLTGMGYTVTLLHKPYTHIRVRDDVAIHHGEIEWYLGMKFPSPVVTYHVDGSVTVKEQ